MRLRRSDCSNEGIRRIRCGSGFRHVGPDGRAVDPATRARIVELAIPPAWEDVWICAEPNGHIQATGQDDAGRKQYLYHERWRVLQDRKKFEQTLEFAVALPKLRRRASQDLQRSGLCRARVLACSIRLLDLGCLRVGSEEYARDNGTYGVATLKKRHATVERGVLTLDYRAKGSRRDVRTISDPLVLSAVLSLKRRRGRGTGLLAYLQSRGQWCDVRAEHINAYLKEAAGGDFSAKDFRTWNATVLAAASVAATRNGSPLSAAARGRATSEAVKQVAAFLGHTPAVCRSSYIDPRVFDRFRDGETIDAPTIGPGGAENGLPADRDRPGLEAEVLRLLG
jgi:DNA topoisomerase-1